MVGAGQPRCVSLAHDHLHVTVAADVGQCPQPVIGPAHDNQRFAGQFDGEVVAGLCCFFFTPDTDPVAPEQVFEFEFVEFFGQVCLGWQAPGLLQGSGKRLCQRVD